MLAILTRMSWVQTAKKSLCQVYKHLHNIQAALEFHSTMTVVVVNFKALSNHYKTEHIIMVQNK